MGEWPLSARSAAGLPYTPADWIVIICSALLLMVFAASAVPSAACVASASWRYARSCCAHRLGKRPEAVESLAARIMEDKRLDRMESLLPQSSFMWATVCAFLFWKTVAGLPRKFQLPQAMCVFVCLLSGVAASGCIRKHKLVLHLVFIIKTTAMTLMVAMADGSASLAYIQCALLLPRTVLSMAYAKCWVVCLFIALHVAASCFTRMRLAAHETSYPGLGFGDYVETEFWISACLVCMTFCVERNVAGQVRKEIEATEVQGEVGASKKLLNTFCDATFELDADYRILDDACQLACVLQRGPGRSLRGTIVSQLVVEQERDLFMSRIMVEVPASQTLANVFHAQLPDSLGNCLEMEVFHVPVVGSITGPCHLIGLREHSDSADVVGPVPSNFSQRSRASLPCYISADSTPTVFKFNARDLAVIESSGHGAELFRVGVSLKEVLQQQQDFFADLEMGLAVMEDKLASDAKASFEFRSSVVMNPKVVGGVWESLCNVVLSVEAIEECDAAEVVVATARTIKSKRSV